MIPSVLTHQLRLGIEDFLDTTFPIITAGLFVGQSEHDPRMVMGADHIITDKATQRRSPPDILLTNYKMLDYLPIRPRDRDLWHAHHIK